MGSNPASATVEHLPHTHQQRHSPVAASKDNTDGIRGASPTVRDTKDTKPVVKAREPEVTVNISRAHRKRSQYRRVEIVPEDHHTFELETGALESYNIDPETIPITETFVGIDEIAFDDDLDEEISLALKSTDDDDEFSQGSSHHSGHNGGRQMQRRTGGFGNAHFFGGGNK